MPKVMVGDCVLREGRVRDAASISMWSTYTLSDMELVASAAMHLNDEDGVCFVCIAPDGSRTGLMLLEVPFLQCVHFIAGARLRGIAPKMVAALVDHYFTSETSEDVLRAGAHLLSMNRRALDLLGFEDDQIARDRWTSRAR